MRQLVSIQKIDALLPIEGADAIEVARILGWGVVVKKGEFNVGDLCVYFEVDSFLPINDARYEFLRKSSYRNNDVMGEGLRIKTVTLRGCLSQGLALPLSAFPELDGYGLGDEVTEPLGVVKWEMPEISGPAGTQKGNKPFGIPTTDETRVQSADALRRDLLGKPYYISTKMDGTSCSIYKIDGQIGVCGRNYEFKDDGTSIMWKTFYRLGVIDRLKEYPGNIVIQGEFCGPGIQKNRIGLKNYDFFVFNAFDYNDQMRLMTLDEMTAVCKELDLTMVPIEERGDSFNYTLEELLVKATGKYPSGKDKEGIVIRPLTPFWHKRLNKSLSFKVLNNDFLKKEKD